VCARGETALYPRARPDSKFFNASGRGTPDIAAFSTNYQARARTPRSPPLPSIHSVTASFVAHTAVHPQVLVEGYTGSISGTSAAAPVVAALVRTRACVLAHAGAALKGSRTHAPLPSAQVARINGERAAAGKPPLGFINHALCKSAASRTARRTALAQW
jgi:hypothetical protein